MYILKDFYGKLPDEKIKIKWNENPIKMEKFLSFLTVPTVQSFDHVGNDTGWTVRENKELSLVVTGGVVLGIEYLDHIQYGKNLANPYNNYVNPFYLSEILTNDGLVFFREYYTDEIAKYIKDLKEKIKATKSKLNELTTFYNKIKEADSKIKGKQK
jgi:hypothetical protein